MLRIGSMLVLLSLAACKAPGEGKKAASGYRFCKHVIAELETYKSTYQAYPDSLEQLPVDSVKRGLLPVHIRDISYYPDSNKAGYELEFSYTGPGMNRCTYSSGMKRWDCMGYY